MLRLKLREKLWGFGDVGHRGFGDSPSDRPLVGRIDQEMTLIAKPGRDLLPRLALGIDASIGLLTPIRIRVTTPIGRRDTDRC